MLDSRYEIERGGTSPSDRRLRSSSAEINHPEASPSNGPVLFIDRLKLFGREANRSALQLERLISRRYRRIWQRNALIARTR